MQLPLYKKPWEKSFFSLVELAVVFIIIAIIAGFSLTAFVKMTKGKSVENSAIIIGSMLKAVRAYAITNNCYAALIFPTDQNINSDYLYRSYRACKVTSSNVFDCWIQDEKWEFLPRGAAISNITNSKTVTGVNFYNIVGSINITDSALAIVFKPTGDIDGSTQQLTISEATYSNGSLVVTNSSNSATITVDQYTGRISYGSM
jgi:Tfp pilus assembly protein FimT